MSLSRRRVLQASLAATAAAQAPWSIAQGPKPIKLLVGFPPGGGTDAIARLLAEKLKDQLGETVIVDNRPGAGGQIAAQVLKASPADGSTLFVTHDHTISILPQVVKKPGFDPDKDFIPAGGFANFVNCFAVSASTPAKSFADYVSWVKNEGHGKSAVGIPAPASTPEFLVQLLGKRYQLDLLAAPYRGSAPMIADMLGNQIPAGIGSVQDFLENHKAAKLRVLAVLGGKRQPALPDVPTFAELGLKGFEDLPYYGVFAPAGTPASVVARLNQVLNAAMQQPDIRRKLESVGAEPIGTTPQELAAHLSKELDRWGRLIKARGIRMD